MQLTNRDLVPIVDRFLISTGFRDCTDEQEFEAIRLLSKQIPDRQQFERVCRDWDIDLDKFERTFAAMEIQ